MCQNMREKGIGGHIQHLSEHKHGVFAYIVNDRMHEDEAQSRV
jgi:hypothetical protein